MSIKMIIATSSKEDGYHIGNDNKLLWQCKEDLSYFKKQTEGGCVVMGNTTFSSLPFKYGLPNRKNLVLSRKPRKSYLSQDVVWLSDCRHILELKDTILLPFKDLWICGGSQIYRQMLPYVSEIHHTEVSGSYPDADTHFMMDFLDNGEWKLYSVEKLCDEATVRVWKRV